MVSIVEEQFYFCQVPLVKATDGKTHSTKTVIHETRPSKLLKLNFCWKNRWKGEKEMESTSMHGV